MKAGRLQAAIALTSILLGAASLAAQEEERKTGWFDTAELSLLMTGGNSESESLALRNTLTRLWERASFKLDAGAFRAETTTISRFAVGTPAVFEPRETSATNLSAENYFLRGRYDRDISDRMFWFAGLGWEQNEFAGIKSRNSAFGGIGHLWFEDDRAYFRTDYGVTYTDQEDLSGTSDSFAGIRVSYDYQRQLTETARFASVLIVDDNLDEMSDLRADFTNSVTASLSERMALKLGLQMLFDNEPSLAPVPLFSGPNAPTGQTVLVPLEDLDTLLTVSLVVDF